MARFTYAAFKRALINPIVITDDITEEPDNAQQRNRHWTGVRLPMGAFHVAFRGSGRIVAVYRDASPLLVFAVAATCLAIFDGGRPLVNAITFMWTVLALAPIVDVVFWLIRGTEDD